MAQPQKAEQPHSSVVAPMMGPFRLHDATGLQNRHLGSRRSLATRAINVVDAKGKEWYEWSAQKVGSDESFRAVEFFEHALRSRNVERFDVPDVKRAPGIEEAHERFIQESLHDVVSENGNRPGDLTTAYQEILGAYLREIQYYYTQGKNGLAALQHLVSEMVHFGLRGPVITQLTNLQAGEKQEEHQVIPTDLPESERRQMAMSRALTPIREQGIKDTLIYDVGAVDHLMMAVASVEELGKPYKSNALLAWVSSNRDIKPIDELSFVDYTLRMLPATKGRIYGLDYYNNEPQVVEDGINAIKGVTSACEVLPATLKDNPEAAIGTELFSILMLNPQLYIKAVQMFGDYGNKAGMGEVKKQIVKQLVRDDGFTVLTDPGQTAHLIHSDKLDLSGILNIAQKAFSAPVFTIGHTDHHHRTTKTTDIFTALREVSNSLFEINAPDISEPVKQARKATRNKVIPLTISSTRIINLGKGEENDEQTRINGLQASAARGVERFGKYVVGNMSSLMFDKASALVGTQDNEKKQKAVDELLFQLMVNTVFVSPDSFMPAEQQKKLRAQLGELVVRTYNLLITDEKDINGPSGKVLTTILQYMYNHWDVEDIQAVLKRYEIDTVLNSNSDAFTKGRLKTFVLSLMFPDAEQHLDYDDAKQGELSGSVAELVGTIAERMPIWFGRADGRAFDAMTFTGMEDLNASLQHEWDVLAGLASPQNRAANRHGDVISMMTEERSQVMVDTIDLMNQLVRITTYLPVPQGEEKKEAPIVDPRRTLVTHLLQPLLDPITTLYEKYISRKAPEAFQAQITQFGQLAQTATSAIKQASGEIDEQAGLVQTQAEKIAEAKRGVLLEIRKIIKEEGLMSGADQKLLDLIEMQNKTIAGQQPGLTAGNLGTAPGMTQLIAAPATQNAGLNEILATVAAQSTRNVDELKSLIRELAIPYASVVQAQAVMEREQAYLNELNHRHRAALTILERTRQGADAYRTRQVQVVEFTHRLAEEKEATVERLLKQLTSLGLIQLVGWYREFEAQSAV